MSRTNNVKLLHITVREMILLVMATCCLLGGYQFGEQRGRRKGHLHGYAEAEDHYQVILSCYAKHPQVWHDIGRLWRDYPDMTIIGEPFENEEQWQRYVQYYAQRNGWKDAAVFQRLEDYERAYAEHHRAVEWPKTAPEKY